MDYPISSRDNGYCYGRQVTKVGKIIVKGMLS